MSDWLVLENFSVFAKDQTLIHPLSLSISNGQNLAVFGSTGSGKSTFLKGIVGLMPFKGKLSLFNKSWNHKKVGRASFNSLYDKIGFAFQQNALFETMTVLENLCFTQWLQATPGKKAEIKEQAEALLQRIGLWEHRQKTPGQLSGGMKKRLAIARAMVKQPEILICDDPLAGLDPISAMTVLDMLMDIVQQGHIGLIISVHSKAVVEGRFTHALVLEKGKSVFFGSVSEMLENGTS